MHDVPLAQAGAIVSVAISNDENHPASNVIDGNKHTYWITTGLMPQSLTISFPQSTEIRNVKLTCFKVKNIIVERSNRPQPTEFDVVDEKSIKLEDHKFSEVDFALGKGFEANHLKFIITEAYDSFVAIQNIHVDFHRGR